MPVPKLYMVLPAFNEQENLPALLVNLEDTFKRLSRDGHNREYVIVDDGSRDDTARIIREHQGRLPVSTVTHDANEGLGITIRDGLRRASELADEDDIVFTMDSDNTHPARLMIRMTRTILEGNDVVIASRYRPGASVVGLNCFRRLMSTGARILFQLAFPIAGVRDYTCGYRAYRAAILKKAFCRFGDAFIESSGFQCMAEILLKISRLNVVINEIPLILRYDLKGGASKMRVGATVLNTLKLMLRLRFRRL